MNYSIAHKSRPMGGFTLIEVMVVVILGILAAIVVPRIMDRPDEARIAKARNDIRTLEQALNLYRLDNFRYPTTEQGLRALVERPTTSPNPETGAPAVTWTVCPWIPGAILTSTPIPAVMGMSISTVSAPTAVRAVMARMPTSATGTSTDP